MMKMSTFFTFLLVFITIDSIVSNVNPNAPTNPLCSPKTTNTNYDDALFVFVIDRDVNPDKMDPLKYILKQFACDIPISNNIKSLILHIGSDIPTKPVSGAEFVNSDQIVGKVDSKLNNNQAQGTSDYCNRLKTHLDSFQTEELVKNRKNIQYVILLDRDQFACNNIDIDYDKQLFIFYHFKNSVFSIAYGDGLLEIKKTDSTSPQLYKLTDRIVSQSLHEKSSPTIPSSSTKSKSQKDAGSTTTWILLASSITAFISLVTFMVWSCLSIKRSRKKLKNRQQKCDNTQSNQQKKNKKAANIGKDEMEPLLSDGKQQKFDNAQSNQQKKKNKKAANTGKDEMEPLLGDGEQEQDIAEDKKNDKPAPKTGSMKNIVRKLFRRRTVKDGKNVTPKIKQPTNSQKKRHMIYIKNRVNSEKGWSKSNRFKKMGRIHIPKEATAEAFTQRCTDPEIKVMPHVFFDEQNFQRFDIGTDIDDIELDDSTRKQSSNGSSNVQSSSAADSTNKGSSNQPTTSTGPSNGPTTSDGPSNGPTTSDGPSNGPTTSAGPSNGPTTSAGPSNGPTTSAGPSDGPTTSAGPSNEPTTAAGPSAGPSTSAADSTNNKLSESTNNGSSNGPANPDADETKKE